MGNPVQIPGYRIERQLGSGGMAKVFLAVQESVQRRVAMKVMSQVLLVDDAFSERFIREARIAANLTHPHIVAVHDVGVHDVHHFIAMEYLPGGDLAHECDQGLVDLPAAVRITREIASALEYAHRKGFVHRDVKPENILFRDNGAAVLTDFGIARAVNSATQMTKTGAVIGTPQYMSPEQARGKDLDGRSDLYSLGIVFYEMLTGGVPYQGTDSVAVGIKHVTDPVPKLPAALSRIQPVLERFLAKNPDQRYATGGEAFVDLQRLEERLSKRPIHNPNQPQDTQVAMPAVEIDDQTAQPAVGELDNLRVDDDFRRPRPQRRQRSRRGMALLVLLLAGASAAWYWQDRLPLDRLWQWVGWGDSADSVGSDSLDPPSQSAEAPLVVDEAPEELATVDLEQGTIERPSDSGSDAPDSSLAIDVEPPANSMDTLLASFVGAIQAGDADAAQQSLDELSRQPGGELRVPELQTQLDALRQAQTAAAEQRRLEAEREQQISALLQQGDQARQSGRWSPPQSDNATDAYRRVLELDANNPHAVRGLRAVAQHYVDLAEAALEADRLDDVTGLIQQIQEVAPDTQALTQIRRRLRLYREQRLRSTPGDADRAALDQHLSAARAAIADNQLLHPPGESAWDQIKAALRIDPNNVSARQELTRLAGMLADDASRLLEQQDLSAGIGRLSQVRQVDPTYPRLPDLESAAASRAAQAAADALNTGQLDEAAGWLDQAERLKPDLAELDQLLLRLTIARENAAG